MSDFSLGITILELACDLDLPRGDEGWHQLRSGVLPEDITAGMFYSYFVLKLVPTLCSIIMYVHN